MKDKIGTDGLGRQIKIGDIVAIHEGGLCGGGTVYKFLVLDITPCQLKGVYYYNRGDTVELQSKAYGPWLGNPNNERRGVYPKNEIPVYELCDQIKKSDMTRMDSSGVINITEWEMRC